MKKRSVKFDSKASKQVRIDLAFNKVHEYDFVKTNSGYNEKIEKEVAESNIEPVTPQWRTSRGAAWYTCGICKEDMPSNDWNKHWQTKGHKAQRPHGTVRCIEIVSLKLVRRSIGDFVDQHKDPKLAVYRAK